MTRPPAPVLALAIAVAASWSCGAATTALTEAERAAIADEVGAAVDAFAGAQRQLDVEAALGFIAPDFYMYVDGQRLEHDAVVAQLRATFATLERFETTWSNVEVTALGRDHALVSMTFRDAITGIDGVTARGTGPTTFVWRRAGSGWQIIYVDADHYPDPSP